MKITSTPQFNQPKALDKTPRDEGPGGPQDGPGKTFSDFYDRHQTSMDISGGALIGAGLARLAGLPSEAVMGAAVNGAIAGYFADDKDKKIGMGAGAAIGATIAALAGAPGAGIVGAAGTGTLVGWLLTF